LDDHNHIIGFADSFSSYQQLILRSSPFSILFDPRLKYFQTGASDPHRSTPGAQQAQAQAQALLQHAAQQQQQLNTAGYTSIKPTNTGIHQAIQQQYHLANGATAATAAGSAANLPSMIKIAASGGRILPSTDIAPQNSVAMRTGGANANAMDDSQGSKKQQKRAANRRSAQLSRKRKKQFIEELREENDDLRRKEQILRAIPDLIVVFDSSGRLGFVSESVGRFLAVPPDELEGTSFWDLICEESVRMLKAAFMDSLAAREADSDTAVLGSGVWELRLKDKSDFIIVTLNGVVHFTGDAPECVCCIRPVGEEQRPKKRQELDAQKQQQKKSTRSAQQLKTNDGNNAESGNGADKSNNLTVSCSDGASRSSDGSSNGTQQSVLGTHGGISMSEQDDAASDAKKRNKKFRRVRASSEEGDNENRSNSSNDNNDNINNLDADGTNNSVRISDGDSNDGIESD
jgi:PAS domain-containing protein